MNLIRGVCLLAVRDGKVLAVTRTVKTGVDGDWGLPGGKVEPGETLEEALIRETQEETGYVVTGPKQVFRRTSEVPLKDRTEVHDVYVFTAEIVGGGLRGSEEGEAAWIDPLVLLNPPCLFRDYNRALFKATGLLDMEST